FRGHLTNIKRLFNDKVMNRMRGPKIAAKQLKWHHPPRRQYLCLLDDIPRINLAIIMNIRADTLQAKGKDKKRNQPDDCNKINDWHCFDYDLRPAHLIAK